MHFFRTFLPLDKGKVAPNNRAKSLSWDESWNINHQVAVEAVTLQHLGHTRPSI